MPDMERFEPEWNFLGVPAELSTPAARCWTLPVPYEGTTSYGAGTRRGPEAIIAASRQVEWYDREFDGEPVAGFGIHTLPPLAIRHGSPEAMTEHVAQSVGTILAGKDAPAALAVLGGEHSISAGIARGLAAVRQGDGMVAVQIDAHADLRDSYEGTPYSHACAARRIQDVCPLFQIGVRNISAEGERVRQKAGGRIRTFFIEDGRLEPGWQDALAEFVQDRPVHLTVDLDGLDPAIMPAVGTPEPGGLSWGDTLDIVRTVCSAAAAVPVFDVVELAPVPGLIAPDFLAAKLVYKILCLQMQARQKQ